MDIREMFEEFFKLPFPIRDTRSSRPRQSQAKGNLSISGRTGECHGKHTLVEVGKRQEQVDWVNQFNQPMRGFRNYSTVSCLRCPYKGEMIILDVETKEI